MRIRASSVNFSIYAKIELRSRSPRMWGWSIRRDGSDVVVQRSPDLFRYAEDAWTEGQRVLACMLCEHPQRVAREYEEAQEA